MTNRHALSTSPSRLLGLTALPLLVALTACGGPTAQPGAAVPGLPSPAGAASAPADPTTPDGSAPASPSVEGSADPTPADPSAGGAVGFDGVRNATIQLEAVGTFVDPAEGDYEAAGFGSGFIIDPSGLAVTNNHVVVGAGTVKVWRGGDTTETLNAKILGSSECLDLAVVQLIGDDDFPWMDWRDADIGTATDVWAAGFPLGDPVFTMTRGIVSKESTIGETPWASIDSVIEHDARIRGGNSGGPLVDADGRLVGVNYAGRDDLDYNYAIHRDEVQDVLPDLIAGTDVLSLGINATALSDENGQGLGIWVNSVKSGSAADRAGIEPGDLLTRMEGVAMGSDGTLSDYCDVLRTHGTDAPLSVEVLRPSDGTYYRGQVNSDEVLAPVSVLGGEGGEGGEENTGNQGGGAEPDPEPAPAPEDFQDVTDDSGTVQVSVPSSWGDVSGTAFTDDAGHEFRGIEAAPDLDAYRSGWDTPGVTVYASEQAAGVVDPADLLLSMSASFEQDGCVPQAADAYADGLHTGVFGYWSECGGVGAATIVVTATSDDGRYVVLVAIQATTEEDLAAVDRILGSFVADFDV